MLENALKLGPKEIIKQMSKHHPQFRNVAKTLGIELDPIEKELPTNSNDADSREDDEEETQERRRIDDL